MAVILHFPECPLARLRRELNFCRNVRMHDRWTDRLKTARRKGALTGGDYNQLVALATVRRFQILMGEVA